MAEQAAVELWVNFAGQANAIIPRDARLNAQHNTLAQVAAAGFLDGYLKAQSMTLLATDFVLCVASDGHQIYKPVFTGTSCQLTVLP